MKLSYEWLKEYVKCDLPVDKITEGLTMSGSEVGAVENFGGDKIAELEITSNRPDCLSIIGLAREVSTIFDKDLHLPDMDIPKSLLAKKGPGIKCFIKKEKLCPYYTCRVIKGVKIKPVGEKIRKRLLSFGLRPVNNAVDVTNFCLLENGQPLHVFDLDKIKGGKVIVRESKKGEVITTLDDVKRSLPEGMLVIADEAGPIAIAGVMGAKGTEVTETTRNILLESAYFEPASIRRASRLLGISSDSSYRFERGVDKGLISKARDRAARLIAEETGGMICGFYEAGKLAYNPTRIIFRLEKAEKVLGIPLKKEKIEKFFYRLGLKIKKSKGQNLVVTIPSFREDLKQEVDLIEEAARIYGYGNIPETVARFVPQTRRKQLSREIIEKAKMALSSLGLNEIMTYSLISEGAAKRFSDISALPAGGERLIASLQNPLSEEQKVLTPHLLDGMLRTISWNLNRKNQGLAFFEVGNGYSRASREKGVTEKPMLCIGLTGVFRKNWKEGARDADFYDLKGTVENLFHKLKILPQFCPVKIESLNNCAEIKIKGGQIGFLGMIEERLLKEYSISQQVYVCQVLLDKVFSHAKLGRKFYPIPRFPASTRDISLLCDQFLNAEDVSKVIFETGGAIVLSSELADVYQGDQIPEDKKSLSYSIKYGAGSRTLTDEEVEAVHSKIKETLAAKLNISFR
ncbi:MAG: phenylalanine--tRNA ligase subunit beta [Candidatus Omnitrophota bacterium]